MKAALPVPARLSPRPSRSIDFGDLTTGRGEISRPRNQAGGSVADWLGRRT